LLYSGCPIGVTGRVEEIYIRQASHGIYSLLFVCDFIIPIGIPPVPIVVVSLLVRGDHTAKFSGGKAPIMHLRQAQAGAILAADGCWVSINR